MTQKRDTPSTDFYGEMTIGKSKIPCAVLYPTSEKPVRIFIQREIVGLLTGNLKGGLQRYLKPANLQPFVPEKFKDHSLEESTIKCKVKGRVAQGFVGTDLIDICNMYLQARGAGVLLESQTHLAIKSEMIIIAFAKTGVNGVIDEVTGYEKVRERFSLNKMLEQHLVDEVQVWAKKFPDVFYKEIFRLNNWHYDPRTVKRPSVIGKWTKEIVYRRFPPGVLGKLEDLNPLTNKGYRKHRYHQFLTEDIGNPKLKEYISNVIFLMKASSNWRKFIQLFERSTGSWQTSLFDDD